MQPILNQRRIARFGMLFSVMTLVTACSSALEGTKKDHTKSTSQALSDDESVIHVSTSVSAWPSSGISSWPSTSTSTSTSTGGGGGGGDPGPCNGCTGMCISNVCRQIGDPCDANRAAAAECDCNQRGEGNLVAKNGCRYGATADGHDTPMIVYTCDGSMVACGGVAGGSHHGEADDNPDEGHCILEGCGKSPR